MTTFWVHSNGQAKNDTNFDGLIGVHDDWDEHWEHDVDEQTDETVEVDATVEPNIRWVIGDHRERYEHVVTVHKWEETFRRRRQATELKHEVESLDSIEWINKQ